MLQNFHSQFNNPHPQRIPDNRRMEESTKAMKRMWIVCSARDARLGSMQTIMESVLSIEPEHWSWVHGSKYTRTRKTALNAIHLFADTQQKNLCMIGDQTVGRRYPRDDWIRERNDFLLDPRAYGDYQLFLDNFGKVYEEDRIRDVFDDHPHSVTDYLCLMGDFDDAVAGGNGQSVAVMCRSISALSRRFLGEGCSVGIILDDGKARAPVVAMVGLKERSSPPMHMAATCFWERIELASGSAGFIGMEHIGGELARECNSSANIRVLGIQGVQDGARNGLWVHLMLGNQYCPVLLRGVKCTIDENERLLIHGTGQELVQWVKDVIVANPPKQMTTTMQGVLSSSPADSPGNVWFVLLDKMRDLCTGSRHGETADDISDDTSIKPAPVEVFESDDEYDNARGGLESKAYFGHTLLKPVMSAVPVVMSMLAYIWGTWGPSNDSIDNVIVSAPAYHMWMIYVMLVIGVVVTVVAKRVLFGSNVEKGGVTTNTIYAISALLVHMIFSLLNFMALASRDGIMSLVSTVTAPSSELVPKVLHNDKTQEAVPTEQQLVGAKVKAHTSQELTSAQMIVNSLKGMKQKSSAKIQQLKELAVKTLETAKADKSTAVVTQKTPSTSADKSTEKIADKATEKSQPSSWWNFGRGSGKDDSDSVKVDDSVSTKGGIMNMPSRLVNSGVSKMKSAICDDTVAHKALVTQHAQLKVELQECQQRSHKTRQADNRQNASTDLYSKSTIVPRRVTSRRDTVHRFKTRVL